MADTIVERQSDRGMSSGMVMGIVIVGLVAIVALFFVFGGPSRFMGSGTPSQTNVNVPAQSQPAQSQPGQSQPQSGPNITIPRQIDVNVNQQPQAPAAPAQPAAKP